MIDFKKDFYNKYGAQSKKYLSVLNKMIEAKFFTCADITKQCNVSFKLVTDLINSLSDYTTKNEKTYFFSEEFIEEYQKETNLVNCANVAQALKEYKHIVGKFTQNKTQLDHISATSETAIKRAVYISEKYDTDHCKIALVGDHDFTSIALSLINPKTQIIVVDIDNDILNFIDELNFPNITTVYADFRVGVPTNLEATCDLVFTDPPYTVEGIDVFLKSSKFLCKKNENSMILCAYTCGDIIIKNGLNVQKTILNNGLYIESIIPKFNIFNLAQSLGYCSDLYVLRLTNFAYKEPIKLPYNWNIYTHGNMSIESKIDNEKNVQNCLVLNSNNGPTLMNILRNGINFCQYQKTDELFFENASMFSFNLLQVLLNLHTKYVYLDIDYTEINNLDQYNYFFNVEKIQCDNFKCKVVANEDIGGIFVQKSFMKLENVLVKFVSLILDKTKNQMREIIEQSNLLSKYRNFQIGSIPINVLIKSIDLLKGTLS